MNDLDDLRLSCRFWIAQEIGSEMEERKAVHAELFSECLVN